MLIHTSGFETGLTCRRRDADQYLYAWTAELAPPGASIVCAAIAGNGSTAFVAVAENGPPQAGIRYHFLDARTGEPLSQFLQPIKPRSLQTPRPRKAMVAEDGSYAVVITDGGDRRYGEFLVFSPRTGVPIFELGIPGRATALDLSGHLAAIGSQAFYDSIGDGGEIYLVDLMESLGNIPPHLSQFTATPRVIAPAGKTFLTCRADNPEGVAWVRARMISTDGRYEHVLLLRDDGAHGDGAAQDSIWGVRWLADLRARDYTIDFEAADNQSNKAFHPNALTLKVEGSPPSRMRVAHWPLFE